MSDAEVHEAYCLTVRHGLPPDFARQHIDTGASLDAFGGLILDRQAADAARISINSRSDSTFFLARSIEGALFARMTGPRPEDAAAELMGRTMLDMGALLLQQRGKKRQVQGSRLSPTYPKVV